MRLILMRNRVRLDEQSADFSKITQILLGYILCDVILLGIVSYIFIRVYVWSQYGLQ